MEVSSKNHNSIESKIKSSVLKYDKQRGRMKGKWNWYLIFFVVFELVYV